MRKKELYRILVDRYLNRTASPEELQVFFHLLEKGKLQKQLVEGTAGVAASASSGAPLASAGAVGSAASAGAAASAGRVRLMVRRYGAAAAIVFALLGVGSFLLWRGESRRNDTPAFVSVLHNDIEPGRDRATLTLADGVQVELNNVDEYNRLQERGGRGDAASEGGSTNGAQQGNMSNSEQASTNGAQQGNTSNSEQASAKGAQQGNTGNSEQASTKGAQQRSASGNRRTPYRLLVTPAGGQYRLTLADGTRVWLNSQSSIRYPQTFAGNTRLVEVTGEAYFDVAHDARRPFIVKAGKMIVQALGTQFNVHAYADEPSKATLIQGSVRVIDGADSLLLVPGQEGETNGVAGAASGATGRTGTGNGVGPVAAGNNGGPVVAGNNGGPVPGAKGSTGAAPRGNGGGPVPGGTSASGATGKGVGAAAKASGEAAKASGAGVAASGAGATENRDRLALNNSADTAQAAAWKDGYFDFDNLDIQAIMRQFARWYDIRVVFAGKPGTALFAGRLQRSLRLSQVMIGLGRMGVHSRLEGRTLTILP